MKKRNVPFIIAIASVVLGLYGNMVCAKGLRHDATAAKQLEFIRKNLNSLTEMKSADSKRRYELALKDLQTMVEKYTGTKEALEAKFFIGSIYYTLASYDEAIECYNVVLNQQYEGMDRNFKARALYFKAKALIEKGDIASSKEVITQLRTIEPRAADSFGMIEQERKVVNYQNTTKGANNNTGFKEIENVFMIKLNSAKSLKDFENLIKDYSAEYAETIPKIEAAILNQVKTKGVGDRLVIKIKRPSEIHGGVSFTFSKNRYAFEFPGDGLPMGFSQYEGEQGSLAHQRSLQEAQDRVVMRLYGDDNINRFDGEVKLYEYYPFFDGYTFIGEGDKFHRLTFAIVKGVGYVYLRGKGSVISKNGEVIRLGYDDK